MPPCGRFRCPPSPSYVGNKENEELRATGMPGATAAMAQRVSVGGKGGGGGGVLPRTQRTLNPDDTCLWALTPPPPPPLQRPPLSPFPF